MSGLNSVRGVEKDLGNGCIFRPDAFTKADGSRMNFQFKKSHGKAPIWAAAISSVRPSCDSAVSAPAAVA